MPRVQSRAIVSTLQFDRGSTRAQEANTRQAHTSTVQTAARAETAGSHAPTATPAHDVTVHPITAGMLAPIGATSLYWSTNAQTGKLVRVWQFDAGRREVAPSGEGSPRTRARRSRLRGTLFPPNLTQMRRTVSSRNRSERPLWLGPYSDTPSYLDGSLVGDYGWDSSGLSSNPERLNSNRNLELIHARWAMLGSLGCLVPELLASFSDVTFGESTWFTAGSQILSSPGLDYLGNPALIHAQSVLAVLFLQVLLIGLAEGYRVAGGPLGESAGLYPGDSLDPLGFGEDSSTLSELQLKELKNGRLAMLSMLGMYFQALCTGKGPVANWQEHIANPTSANGFAYATKLAPSMLA